MLGVRSQVESVYFNETTFSREALIKMADWIGLDPKIRIEIKE